jgi:hypothetical protein
MNKESWETTLFAGVALLVGFAGLAIFAALIGFFLGVAWSVFTWLIQ